MEKKISNILLKLSMFLLLIVAGIGLVACGDEDSTSDIYYSEDDEDMSKVYFGYIEYVSQIIDMVSIKVTQTPSELEDKMPIVDDEVHIYRRDYPRITFKEDQKILFRIIEAKSLCQTWEISYALWDVRLKLFLLNETI